MLKKPPNKNPVAPNGERGTLFKGGFETRPYFFAFDGVTGFARVS
jgi:hypothetical protein